MLQKMCGPLHVQTRRCSSAMVKSKPKVLLDETTRGRLEREEIKPRKHPGIVYRKNVQLPKWTTKAIKLLTEDQPDRQLMEDAAKFYRHLQGRHPPVEKNVLEAKLEDLKKVFEEEKRVQSTMPENEDKLQRKLTRRAQRVLRANVQYNSLPLEYDKYKSILYLMARGAPDYAVLYKIFHEIKMRDAEFAPKNLIDFGSGVGTVSWAASHFWSDSLTEHVCVDASNEMNDLAAELVKHAEPKIKGIFYRQFLPMAPLPMFDMVVSAFSLFELPDTKARLETLLNLWRKTNKYMVIIEQGTNAGFKLVNEARDLILHLIESVKDTDGSTGSIFSPCPHEFGCPRMKANDGTPCNFLTSYTTLSQRKALVVRDERYSYVVFKKGADRDEQDKKWPRIVRPPLLRSRLAICRMCTANGKLQEIIFSAGKHERPVFYCARSSEWGDRLPIEILSETDK